MIAENIRIKLVAHGISPGQSRSAAMFALAGEIPAPILTELIGIKDRTAAIWTTLAARDWSEYVTQREPSYTRPPPRSERLFIPLRYDPCTGRRNAEYDPFVETYVRFLLEEVLPRVEERFTVSTDPMMRGICGGVVAATQL